MRRTITPLPLRRHAQENPAVLVKDLSASTRGHTKSSVKLVKTEDPVESAELVRLDEQIVELRKRHDKLHDSNARKRKELDSLASFPPFAHQSPPKRLLLALAERVPMSVPRTAHRTACGSFDLLGSVRTFCAALCSPPARSWREYAARLKCSSTSIWFDLHLFESSPTYEPGSLRCIPRPGGQAEGPA